MKRTMVVLGIGVIFLITAVFNLLYSQEAVQNEKNNSDEETQTISVNLEKLLKGSENLVIGKTIQVGEFTLIPVSRLKIGFGYGEIGTSGEGGGGGGSITPQALIVIGKGEVKVLFLESEKTYKESGMEGLLGSIVPMLKMWGKKAATSEKTPRSPQHKLTADEIKEKLNTGRMFFNQGKLNEALKVFEEIVHGIPENAEAHAWLSLTLGRLCGQISPNDWQKHMDYGMRACEEADKALKLEPDNSVARLSKGINLLFTPPQYGGSIEEAIKNFEIAVQKTTDKDIGAESHYWLGVAYEKQGKKDKANEEWEKVLKINPEHPEVLKKLKR